jgi:hypothetical protein
MQKFFAKNGKSWCEREQCVKKYQVPQYVLYFKTVVLKHAEQTTVKQQENSVS